MAEARTGHLLAISAVLLALAGVAHSLGVNWGTMASHPLNPDIVVRMVKDNKFDKVKLFEPDPWTMSELSGTGIEIMVGIPNDQLARLAKDPKEAADWVKENVTQYLKKDKGANIKYVAVGNEPFLSSYNGSFVKSTFPAFKNIQNALNEAGVGDKIKATIPQNAEVYESPSNKPSEGSFRDDIAHEMLEIVRYFHKNGNPFTVNIYPFLSLYQDENFPVEFAFFDGDGKPIYDHGKKYTNVFDANLDSLIWALKKGGVTDMDIIVGEIGWPTDGNKFANATMAERFYAGLMKKLAQGQGTPLLPGKLDVYLFGLLDENNKSILPGPFERHWGIFRYDGQPKFPLDLTGRGRKVMPVGAKNVEYQERQWCVFNKEAASLDAVVPDIEYACAHGDCTSLQYGGSCNKLDKNQNASYAFNMYFQMQNQDVRACDFKGAAKIVKQNASVGHCLFPIEIVSRGHILRLPLPAMVFSMAGALISFFALV